MTRRETLKGLALLGVADKLTDGGYAAVSLPGLPDRGTDVLPPGARDSRTYFRKCIGCQLCVRSCPGGCLKPSMRLSTFGQPLMDFRKGYCIANCVRCGEVCPEGAIDFLQREQRPQVHMGCAIWRKDLCLRMTENEKCTACVRKCPVQAIHLVKDFPVVDREACIGCGACEHVCPSRPQPAIYVQGYETQRVINPISEDELVAEMRARLEGGAAAVVARNGIIIAVEEGHGLEPLLRLLDAGKLKGSLVMDRVVGRASAAICVAGGVKKVLAPLAGKEALVLLEKAGIELQAAETVDGILNRERSGICPMESAVAGLEDVEKMINAIRKAVIKR